MRAATLGVALAMAASSVALGSCGEDADSSLDDALGYLPEDAPVVVAISTDLESDAYQDLDAAAQRFGVEGGVDAELEDVSEAAGVPLADIEPLLGNDLVIGTASATSGELGEDFVGALRVSDADAARQALAGIEGFEEKEEIDGATVYGPEPPDIPDGADIEYDETDAEHFAVDGEVVVAAESLDGLEAALAQRNEEDRLTAEVFEDRLGELPSDAIVRASGDSDALLEAAGGEQLGAVPWIASLQAFGASIGINDRELTLDVEVAGDEVSEEDLPVAVGPQPAEVAEDLPSLGTRDQSPTISVALEILRASVPAAAFEEVTRDLEDRLGTGLDPLLSAFGSGVTVMRGNGETITRSEVEDPRAVAQALAKLRDEVPRLAQLATEYSAAGEALELAKLLVPALPIPEDSFASGGLDVTPVPGQPDLYRLLGPRPAAAEFDPADLPPDMRELYRQAELERPEFVFGMLDGAFVTAESIDGARLAASLSLTAASQPGAVTLRYPVESAEFGIPVPEGGGVTLTVIEAGLEASVTGLRLTATAGL